MERQGAAYITRSKTNCWSCRTERTLRIGKVAFTEDIKKMEKLLLQEDEPIHTFTIAPTNAVFERFQKYYRDLRHFFRPLGQI